MVMTMLSYHSIYYVSAARIAGVTEYLILGKLINLAANFATMFGHYFVDSFFDSFLLLQCFVFFLLDSFLYPLSLICF